jgi:hypothetical protein
LATGLLAREDCDCDCDCDENPADRRALLLLLLLAAATFALRSSSLEEESDSAAACNRALPLPSFCSRLVPEPECIVSALTT